MVRLVPRVKPRSRMHIEKLAEREVRSFSPRLLKQPGRFPILQYFEFYLTKEYGLDTGVEQLSDGVEGITWPDGRVLVSESTYRAACEERGRRARFTVAHECGHGIMHRDEIEQALIDNGKLVLHRRQSLAAFLDPEWQANYFAGAILMPRDAVRRLAKDVQRMFLPDEMVHEFGVSYTAANVRLEKLGI